MSIDLKVFPTTPDILFWGDIKRQLYRLISPEQNNFFGKNISCFKSCSQQKVPDDEQLSLDQNYYLSLAIPNTLSISVISKSEDIDEESLEVDYLEDYGCNLDNKEIQTLAELWRVARYFYNISSFGGRSQDEPKLLITLVTAISYASAGYIIVTNNNLFDLGIGVYKSEEFQYTKPRF